MHLVKTGCIGVIAHGLGNAGAAVSFGQADGGMPYAVGADVDVVPGQGSCT